MRCIILLALVATYLVSCNSENPDFSVAGDTDTDTDGDSDTDTDTDIDTDTDTDSDTDSDSDSDGGPDTDTDTDSDTDTGSDPCDLDQLEDFEADDGLFVEDPTDSVWEWGAIVAGAPEEGHGNVWATNLSGDYNNCDSAFLNSPTIDLSMCGGMTLNLQFDIWYEYEGDAGDWDGLLVEFWDGSAWVQIDPVGGWDTTSISASQGCTVGTPPYVNGKPGFTGESTVWVTVEFQYTPTAFSTDFGFRFAHGSDGFVIEAGAYIDNISMVLQ
jgi:hypothetical protein